jgi:hypothetical protein
MGFWSSLTGGLGVVCLRRCFALFSRRSVFAPPWLYSVLGLSLNSRRSICVAPVRGGTYFSLSPKGTSFGASSKEK